MMMINVSAFTVILLLLLPLLFGYSVNGQCANCQQSSSSQPRYIYSTPQQQGFVYAPQSNTGPIVYPQYDGNLNNNGQSTTIGYNNNNNYSPYRNGQMTTNFPYSAGYSNPNNGGGRFNSGNQFQPTSPSPFSPTGNYNNNNRFGSTLTPYGNNNNGNRQPTYQSGQNGFQSTVPGGRQFFPSQPFSSSTNTPSTTTMFYNNARKLTGNHHYSQSIQFLNLADKSILSILIFSLFILLITMVTG